MPRQTRLLASLLSSLALTSILSISLAHAASSSSSLGSSSHHCLLSNLALSGVQYHDVDGNGFAPEVLEYQCNLAPSQKNTRVTVSSQSEHAEKSKFQLSSAGESTDGGASGAVFKQYLHTDSPSASLVLAEGTTEISLTVTVPSTCSLTYKISCHKQPSSSFVTGDPQFQGLRGQEFQVHGVAGEVYNIISDPHFQMNARFVYLDRGSCPVLQGRRGHGCWSHPGSYLGDIGIKTSNGDTIRLLSGHASEGFEKVTINERALRVGSSIKLPCPDGHVPGRIWYNSTHTVTMEVGHFHLEFDNSDLFINQRVRVLDWSELGSHGLLGQTWRKRTYDSPLKFVEGTVDDYLIRDGSLFGHEFLYNQYRDLTQ